MNNNIRVSEIVTIKEIESWNDTDTITIKAGTGSGKSYFIKNILYAIAKRDNKKILMLIHRTNCITQFQEEIKRDKKTDVIEIMTYQKLEFTHLQSEYIDLKDYQYIVCDEFHYFMGDASFSKTTDISLNIILQQLSATKIFMSATGDYMKRYLNDIKEIETIDYELPITYDFIEKLIFYNSDEYLETFIKKVIKNNKKAILFIQSAEKAYDLYKKYKKYCLFNCSKNNADYYKYIDKTKINNMLVNERFEELILITTTCLDAGVNIIDLNLKHILCDVEDTGTLIQCIGRKRIQNKNDKIYLFIKTICNKSLGGKVTQLNKKLKMAEFLKTHTVKEFIKKYEREYDKSNIVYDDTVKEDNKGTKKVNDLMYFKCKNDLFEIKHILEGFGYCDYIKKLFNMKKYKIIEKINKENELIDYLNKLIGKRLLKKDQKELAIKVDIKKNRKLLKSYGSLNAYFLEDNINFMIKPFTDNIKKLKDGSKNPQFGKVYWIIYKIISEIKLGNGSEAL